MSNYTVDQVKAMSQDEFFALPAEERLAIKLMMMEAKENA